MDDVGVAGQHVGAGEPGVLGQLRVEQEAAVVVGAEARGGRRRVRPRHLAASAASRLSRSGLGLVASMRRGVVGSACVGRPVVAVAAVVGGLGRRRRCWSRPARRSGGGSRRRSRRPPAVAMAQAGGDARSRGQAPDQPGGQVIGPAAEHVQVRVEHRLPDARAGVEDQPVVLETLAPRRRRGASRTRRARASGSAAASSAAFGVVAARDHQHVGRRLRVDVAERHGAVGGLHHVARGCRRPRSCRTGSPRAHAAMWHGGRRRTTGRAEVNPGDGLRVRLA